MRTTARERIQHATTFITHMFGGGLDQDERFVVERFESMVSGEIRPRVPTGRPTARASRAPRCRAEA